jgi:hypothetical protein
MFTDAIFQINNGHGKNFEKSGAKGSGRKRKMQQQKVNIEALTARRRKVWVTLAKKEIGKVLFDCYDLFPFLTKILHLGSKSTQQLP